MISFQGFKGKKTNQRESFREIYDFKVNNFDNIRFPIKITRVFIRYIIRIVGYEKGILFLNFFIKLFNLLRPYLDVSYIIYILEINIYKIKCQVELYSSNIQGSVKNKIKWAEYTIKNSSSIKSRINAKVYLSLLAENEFYDSNYRKISPINQKLLNKSTNKLFYIYGPNSKNPPNKKYKNYTIVVLKPIDFDLSIFAEKILFVNGYYYNKKMSNNSKHVNELVSDYDKVIVSCLLSELDDKLERAKFPIFDNISAPMALGRILYNLIYSYGVSKSVIEGFDFYLDNRMYAEYYPSGTRNNGVINEQSICNSLAVHDALFNFLYVKELCGYLEVIDSHDFKKILTRSGQWYITKLQKIRDFSTLKKV